MADNTPESKRYPSVKLHLLGSLSLGAFYWWPLTFAAMATLLFAFCTRHRRRLLTIGGRRQEELCIAVAGLVLMGAPVWHYKLYQSEAPPGFERVHFANASTATPNGLSDYCEKKICLKGYPLQMNRIYALREICFCADGDYRNSKDIVLIEIPAGWDWQPGCMAISGVMTLNDDPRTPECRYRLKAVDIRPAKTPFGAVRQAAYTVC